MEIQIRVATPKDFTEIHHLIKDFAAFIKTPEKVSITPQQMVKDKEHFNCIVAVDGSKIIGFATYFFAYYSWSGRAIYLDDLYVVANYRANGIGNRLFEEVRVIGQEESCIHMKWQVSKWNKKAQEFYIHKGAVIEDVEVNCSISLI